MVLHEDERSFVIPDFANGTRTVPKLRSDMPWREAAPHPAFDAALRSVDPARKDEVVRRLAATLARELYIRDFGFAMLTSECAQALATLLGDRPTLEVGAGSGYLSAALAQRGVDITASDLGSPQAAAFGIGRVHRRDHEGDSLALLPGRFEAVLMSWPSGRFGAQVAGAMGAGQWLVYQGEGLRGRTADNAFFAMIADPAQFEELPDAGAALEAQHLRFAGWRDAWRVFVKR